MAQQDGRDGFSSAFAPTPLISDRAPDQLAIFSAPALEVVFHWWAESNRRWTERNRSNPLTVDPLVVHGRSHAPGVESDRTNNG